MALTRVVAFGKAGTIFQTTVTQTGVDVGSASGRVAYVWLGTNVATSTTPVSVTVGTDTLSNSQAEFADASGYKWRLYYGSLTVTGAQSVVGTVSDTNGLAQMVGVVYSDVDAALIASYAATSSTYDTAISVSVSSATGNKVVCLVVTDAVENFTGGSGTTNVSGTTIGSGTYLFVFEEDGASSTSIGGNFDTVAFARHASFSVPAGGAGSSSLPLYYYAQL